MTERHIFLSQLHELLKPEVYLEIGVQFGDSLRLATHSKLAIGIDPMPVTVASGNQQIYPATSDDYFNYSADPDLRIDLAYIDGSHRYEDALRDFMNIELHSHKGTVVVFDDVLPYSQSVGGRHPVPGHWAGDVWKMHEILTQNRPELQVYLTDTGACTSAQYHPAGIVCAPTGTMVVWGLDAQNMALAQTYDWLLDWRDTHTVPDTVLNRTFAVAPETILDALREARA